MTEYPVVFVVCYDSYLFLVSVLNKVARCFELVQASRVSSSAPRSRRTSYCSCDVKLFLNLFVSCVSPTG